MTLIWAENTFSNLYPLIKNLYKDDKVIKKSRYDIEKLDQSVGLEIEKKILTNYTPSFFSMNLCSTKSLCGRFSSGIYFVAHKLRLDRVFTRFNQKSKLCSIVLKAEQCWLGFLLDAVNDKSSTPDFIALHLSNVVVDKNEKVSTDEIKNRLNQLIALTNVYYEVHGLGHNYVTGRVPKTYFDHYIFNKVSTSNPTPHQ